MAKFKIGDKVIAKKNDEYAITTDGWRGTVVGTLENPNGQFIAPGDDICVRGNEDIDEYSVESKYFDFDESTSNQKIVITTDGKTTTAKQYDGKKVVKTAKAICSPEDAFDFERGALIAFSRLVNCDYRLADDTNSFNWKAFKNDEFFVQVTEDNFDNFVEEAKKHGCSFEIDLGNSFINCFRLVLTALYYERFICVAKGILCAPEDTVYISCMNNSLKFSVANPDKKTVFVW